MSAYDYRPFLPASGHTKIAGPTPRAHAQARMKNPRAQGLFGNWERMFAEPFRGITTDGGVIPDLYAQRPEGAPTLAMIEAVNALLALMTPEQRALSCFPVDSPQWRHWQNTELYVENYGLRLDEVTPQLQGSHHGGAARQHERARLCAVARRDAAQPFPRRSGRRPRGDGRVELYLLFVR
jgi:hypothetical protein